MHVTLIPDILHTASNIKMYLFRHLLFKQNCLSKTKKGGNLEAVHIARMKMFQIPSLSQLTNKSPISLSTNNP